MGLSQLTGAPALLLLLREEEAPLTFSHYTRDRAKADEV